MFSHSVMSVFVSALRCQDIVLGSHMYVLKSTHADETSTCGNVCLILKTQLQSPSCSWA